MKRVFRFFKIAAILTAAIGLAGCAASGMKNVENSGFLKDYGQLRPGADDRAALNYFKPGVDFKPYTKLMFERVSVFLSPTLESREIDPTSLKELADFYQNALLIPVGMVVAGATKAVSDANLGTGEAATEMEVLDSMTKERLAAAVDRRQGGKSAFRGKWVDTKQAFEFWAKRFRERLDGLRGL